MATKTKKHDLRIEDVCRKFNVSLRTVRRWLASDDPPPHVQPGGYSGILYFNEQELDAWAKKRA